VGDASGRKRASRVLTYFGCLLDLVPLKRRDSTLNRARGLALRKRDPPDPFVVAFHQSAGGLALTP
jgi:hypothetical protein